jgi:hypothetical protein
MPPELDDVLTAVGLTLGIVAIVGAACCYDMSEAEDNDAGGYDTAASGQQAAASQQGTARYPNTTEDDR